MFDVVGTKGAQRAQGTEPVGPHGAVAARIQSLLPSLQPAEQQVAQVLLDQRTGAVDLSSQQIAELSNTSRATVVRTCRSLGYQGFAQIRVLLTRDAALAAANGETQQALQQAPTSPAAAVLDRFAKVAADIPAMTSMLDPSELHVTIERLATSSRVLVAGHGLSWPLAAEAEARLIRLGILTEAHPDRIQERISARRLGPEGTALVISGSGASVDAVATARAAAESGATVVAITAFARSPLASIADHALVVCQSGSDLADELYNTSRVPEHILMEGLMEGLRKRLGPRAIDAAALALQEVSRLVEE